MTQKIETTIAALAKRADQLAIKRAKAQDALDKATKARQDALLSGDLDDERALARLQAVVDTAASAVTGIDDAITVLARQKSEAEAQLTAERERVKRAEAADKLAVQVSAIATVFKPWLERSRVLADTLAQLEHWHFGCNEMSQFLQSAMGQLETAMNIQVAELQAMPKAIIDGVMDVPPPKPVAAPPAVTAEPEPTRTVFCLRSIRWKSAAGREYSALQYEDVQLPLALAEKALRRGVCVPVTDDRRKTLRNARGGHHANVNAIDIVDLDALDDPKAPYVGPETAEVLRQADFKVVDRGPARTGVINVARVL
ncbi:hypothetical protein [Bradyrhizobium sp. ARR65]|uniref:hypothetical protein n=1 Tax=Bradyrhizobium sp. ARR65 TaxID=1040989 RepID=UPI00046407C0|nr:hypothetical protein [Bradyrhizobium sp. ARR65]